MISLLPQDGEIYYFSDFFTPEESIHYFYKLLHEIEWKQEPIKLFGKEIMQPRLTAWYGDIQKSYSYSGITMNPFPWTETLLKIKSKIEAVAEVSFTSALLNLYRDEKDSMGWHKDDEKELGTNPVIGSVSLGATRTFLLKHIRENGLKTSLDLVNGSFLLMKGETQHHWLHSIPKNSAPVGPRINLTFRILL